MASCTSATASRPDRPSRFALIAVGSNEVRPCGVASLLWGAAIDRARGNGAGAIYVSATPSDSAVGFYLSRGCRLATRSELNDHLYELEPDDVHLICEL
jgi:predicted N-acetyltransferase YhbS